jgi:glyceraldehyde 3-phosphate dehydrogenase
MAQNKKIRVGINGFGRIGRAAFKVGLGKPEVEFVAINDLTSPEVLATLLKYDTAYGKFEGEISFDKDNIVVNGVKIPIIAEKDPSLLPWKKMEVDVVIESTGRFTKDGAAAAHIKAGAKRVVISAPAKGGNVPTVLLGVNHDRYGNQEVISNASCTTNCISPVIHVLHQSFGVQKAMMNTVHSYTAEQNLVDGPPPGGHADDLRRARAAAQNMVPTTTGAAIATTEAITDLKGVFDGIAIRVPTIVGSLANIVAVVKKPVTVEEVNKAFEEAAVTKFYQGILEVNRDPIVSSDIVGTSASTIVDLPFTRVIGGDLVSILAWYDNEWGYSNRLIEEVILVGKTLQ